MSSTHIGGSRINDLIDKMAPSSSEGEARERLQDKEFAQYKKLIKKRTDYELKEREKLIDILSKDEQRKTLDFEKTLKQKREEAHQEKLDMLKAEYLVEENNRKKLGLQWQITMSDAGKKFGDAIGSAMSKALSNIDNYIGTFSQYLSQIETRLYGSGSTYSSLMGTIKSNLNMSPYVKQTVVLENLSKYVEQGIAYNIEQRAFLASVSDRIATTFDAFDASLLQIIRIQQADSTVARLGIESSLTKFLNEQFKDTSYLSNLSSNISASLLGAESQLGVKGGAELEYTIQKWLGSMYSVGVGSSTIQQLAQGLGALGTGDISTISNNQQLQRLLLMGAQRSGIDYSQILTGGLSSSAANQLLQGIVEYGMEIARESNQVVKSQYASMFGLTMSDLTALLNLAEKTQSIADTLLDYQQAVSETESRLSTIGQRTAMKDMIENVFSNTMAGIGETIAESAGLYTTWLAANAIEQMGVEIPLFGFGSINLGTTAKGAMAGTIGIMNLLSSLGSLTNGGSLNLSNWKASKTVGGQTWGYTGISAPSYEDVAYGAYMGMSTETDIYRKSILNTEEATVIAGHTQEDILSTLQGDISDKLDTIIEELQNIGINVSKEYITNMGGL